MVSTRTMSTNFEIHRAKFSKGYSRCRKVGDLTVEIVILWNPKLSSVGHEPQANEARRIYGNSTTRKEKEEKKKKHTKNTS